MNQKLIPVLEIFGPTVQGEGMVIGQKTMFVRTAGCDYSCSWCDSAFTWDGTAKDEIKLMTSEDILRELEIVGRDTFQHVTISGGNPALLNQLDQLIDLLHEKGIQVALETQGSRWQDWFLKINDLTLSPKPPSSNMITDWDVLDGIIERLVIHNRKFSLKIVVFDEIDLEYAVYVHQRYPDLVMYLQIGNDDLKETNNERLLARLLERYEWLVDTVMKSNELKQVRVLPQLHAWLWGNKRGV